MVITRTDLKKTVLREWTYTKWEKSLPRKERETWRESLFYRALRNLQRKGEITPVSLPIPGSPGRTVLAFRLTPEGVRALLHSLSE